MKKIIHNLSPSSTEGEINYAIAQTQCEHLCLKEVIELIFDIANKTNCKAQDLIKRYIDQNSKNIDWSLLIAEITLVDFFNHGKHIVYTDEKAFWHYNQKFWEPLPPHLIKNKILQTIENYAPAGRSSDYSYLTQSTLSILECKCAKTKDPLGFKERPIRRDKTEN